MSINCPKYSLCNAPCDFNWQLQENAAEILKKIEHNMLNITDVKLQNRIKDGFGARFHTGLVFLHQSCYTGYNALHAGLNSGTWGKSERARKAFADTERCWLSQQRHSTVHWWKWQDKANEYFDFWHTGMKYERAAWWVVHTTAAAK